MKKLNIIGVGTKKIDDISLKGFQTLKIDGYKYLRTDHHPFVNYLKEENIEFNTFDSYFEDKKNLEEVYKSIIDEIKDKVKSNKDVNYYVPGSPYYGDVVTEYFINNEIEDLEVEIVDSISFWQKALSLIGGNKERTKTISGEEYNFYDIDINSNLLFTQIYTKDIA
ncbi:MAG TPA: hypothetical protein DHM42_03125, partial [Clostridiales bacterium]|nr:hypothetical protein [Clostridiales bacterium]